MASSGYKSYTEFKKDWRRRAAKKPNTTGQYHRVIFEDKQKFIIDQDKTFVEPVYHQMLKKSGRKKKTPTFDFEKDLRNLAKNRPEYAMQFKMREL